MELELKHIAPYLPYGLKVMDKGNDNKIVANTSIIAAVAVNYPNAIIPLLRPMSDLFKEIGHQGKKVCVADLITFYYDDMKYWNEGKTVLHYPNTAGFIAANKEVIIPDFYSLKYGVIEMLFKYHFDVFGLIEKGLAEPIADYLNELTIKKNGIQKRR